MKKIFSGTLKYIKRVYQKVIDQNNKKRVEYTLNKSISVDSYTKEIFLEPENVLKYLNKYKQYKINDLTDYKDIINSILFDNGTYKLSESDKSYYLKIFSELLEEKINYNVT